MKEKERERETHQCVVASHVAPTGDLARNPGIFPAENLTGDLGSQPVFNPLMPVMGKCFLLKILVFLLKRVNQHSSLLALKVSGVIR